MGSWLAEALQLMMAAFGPNEWPPRSVSLFPTVEVMSVDSKVKHSSQATTEKDDEA